MWLRGPRALPRLVRGRLWLKRRWFVGVHATSSLSSRWGKWEHGRRAVTCDEGGGARWMCPLWLCPLWM